MSAELLGLAFKAEMGSHVAKLVLLKLVDAGEDDGTSIYPAVKTIAAAAQAHERTVQKLLKVFQRVGLLELVRQGGGGPGDTNEYRLNLRVLYRIKEVGWAKATGQDSEGSDAAGEGGLKPPIAMGGIDAEKGGLEAAKGGPSGHPTSKIDPSLDQERESAGARDEEKSRLHRRFRALAGKYPSAALDPLGKAEAIWTEMPEDKRLRAEERLPAFIDTLKGSKRRPPLQEYLGEDKFDLVEATAAVEAAKAAGRVAIAPFSRDFWIVFARRAPQGARRVSLMVDQALRNVPFGIESSEAPSEAEITGFVRIDVDSAEWKAWIEHWATSGVIMPRPSVAAYVWMPGRWPPDQRTADAFTADEVEGSMG